MVVFTIAGMFLVGVVAMTTSQHCIKRYVGGEWITHGDCGNLPTISSILSDIEERAKAEEANEDPKELENFIAEQSKKGNIVRIEKTVKQVTDAPDPTSSAPGPTSEAKTATRSQCDISYQYPCADGTQCVHAQFFCDYDLNCRDGSDERPLRNTNIKYSANETFCKGRRRGDICALRAEEASSLGKYCAELREGSQCSSDEYPCADGTQCVLSKYFCDRIPYCRDGSDERPLRNINIKYSANETFCKGKRWGHICVLRAEEASSLGKYCAELRGALPPLRCGNEPWELTKSLNETGGVVDINIPELGLKEVYCDIRTDGGGWIVFQRRMDGSENFFRNWTDYVNGFGTRNKEFWLGLEAIHQLTKDGDHELRIDMIERNGTHYFAKYSSFKVKSASSNYNVTASGYSGNATDSLLQWKTEASFSTRDRDNDRHGTSNCAEDYNGGWWYHECHSSNLNGMYEYGVTDQSEIVWNSGSGKWMFMKFTEMKLRKKN